MPIRRVPGTEVDYHLVLFDEDGQERAEDGDEVASKALLEQAGDGVTDIFLTSHGWQGDIPAAIRQYDKWIGAVARQQRDRDRIREVVPDFKALLVGVHWPSLPWGVEETGAALLGGEDTGGGTIVDVDEFAVEAALDPAQLVSLYAPRIGDTPETRMALTTIVTAGADPQVGALVRSGELPPALRTAYRMLFEQAGLGSDGAVAAPGADQPGFDPAASIQEWTGAGAAPGEGALLGWFDDAIDEVKQIKDTLLIPVRQVSFWRMKRRARTVGETGVHDLVADLMAAAPGARVHIMGHSFGCIVVSAAIAGPKSGDSFGSPLPRPVDAVFLVQGAMSLWSYADQVPFESGQPGYFRRLLEDPAAIRGPLVTTRSSFDTAVGKFYPLGARVSGDVLLGDESPKYGGIGTFGIMGTADGEADDVDVQAETAEYGFRPGPVYNVDASRVIRNGGGPVGAHNDISHDEIAHLLWQAVTGSVVS